MSDIEEDDDREVTSAPGKENEDPNKPHKLKVTQSFILKHGASTTKTCSDSSCSSTSDGGGVPIDMLKAMHLDADRARGLSSSKSEHFRLSGESYKPPSVESLPGEEDKDAEMQDACAVATDSGASPAQASDPHRGRRPSSANKGCQTVSDSLAATLASTQHRVSAIDPVTGASSNKKTVRWSEDFSGCPVTADSTTSFAPQPYHSDSGFSSSGYRSDASMRSTGSARGRLRRIPPGEYSTGSPPRREGTATPASKDDRDHGEHWQQEPQLNDSGQSLQHLPPSQGTFGDDVGDFVEGCEGPPMPIFASGPTLSGYPGATNNLPTPPDSHDQPEGASTTGNMSRGEERGNFEGLRQWNSSPDQQVPNFSRPYQSPRRGVRTGAAYHAAATYVSSPGHGTRPDYIRQQQQQRPPPVFPAFSSSTHFSDSTTRRDFSGYTAAPTDENDAFHRQYFDTLSEPGPDAGIGYYGRYEHEWDMPFEGQGQRQDYYHHTGNDFNSFSAPQSCSAFDFSYLNGEQTGTETKFVRKKKTDSSSNATAAPEHPTTTPSRSQQSHQQWYLYEDDDATFDMYGSEVGEGNYHWRDDRTTIHHSGSTGPSLSSDHNQMATGNNQPRNVVTILSIREITSDEELCGCDEGKPVSCSSPIKFVFTANLCFVFLTDMTQTHRFTSPRGRGRRLWQ